MWNLDIWLPVAVGLLTFVLAFMGVFVTLYPPGDTSKRIWWIAFGIVALAGGGLITWQAVRSVNAQSNLEAELNKIQHNTEQPPTVNVPAPIVNIPSPNVPKATAQVRLDRIESPYKSPQGSSIWLTSGKDIAANLFFNNEGQATASQTVGCSRFYVVAGDPSVADSIKDKEKAKDAHKITAKFKKYCEERERATWGRATMDPGGKQFIWFTAHSERALSQTDLDNLSSGGELMFLLYSVRYEDPAGRHEIHRCMISQPPAFNPEVWQACD